MILLPIDAVKPYINDFYLTFRNTSELLGFMPCSNRERGSYSFYYSCETTKGARVVPVFYEPNMQFDSSWKEPGGPALFFMGCDDGHMGLKFESREAALTWIDEYPINDFELMITLDHENFKAGKPHLNLQYHN